MLQIAPSGLFWIRVMSRSPVNYVKLGDRSEKWGRTCTKEEKKSRV